MTDIMSLEFFMTGPSEKTSGAGDIMRGMKKQKGSCSRLLALNCLNFIREKHNPKKTDFIG